jgi:hypothetical protein
VSPYETTADGQQRCPEHGRTFSAIEYCPECPVVADVETPADRPSEAQADADASLCRTVRDEILAVARSYSDERDDNESKDRIGWSTVAKLYDCALKWHRAAMEERMKREDKDFAAWLVEEKRRLLDRGASH